MPADRPLPAAVRTARLLLRRWDGSDAAALLPILEQNQEHLRRWIPQAVYSTVPLEELAQRLAGYAADFDAGRAWRYAVFDSDDSLIGEVSLFPRTEEQRVAIEAADRVEIGYWLRRDATGQGHVSEAVRMLMQLAAALPRIRSIEVHCDPRNEPSAAIPRRLGFILLSPVAGGGMVWRHELTSGG